MNTTVVSSLNGSHIGKTLKTASLEQELTIVSITHKQDGNVVIRWGYQAHDLRGQSYKKTFDTRYKPDTELRLM